MDQSGNPVCAFPGSLATGGWGTWSSCSSGLTKGFLAVLPLSYEGGGTALLPHFSCLKGEGSAVKVVLATDPESTVIHTRHKFLLKRVK